MAKVQYVGAEPVTVGELGGLLVNPDDVIEVPDDRYEGYVPPAEHRSEDHPWQGVEAPDTSEIRGKALDDALRDRDLPTSGTADEKRQRLADSLASDTEEN